MIMPPFTVQYLCTYRPVWYDDDQPGGAWLSAHQAVWRAMQIAAARHTQTRVLDADGQQVWPQ